MNVIAPQPKIGKKIQKKKSDAGKKRAKRACGHCKKAKTSCSNNRPCERCVRLGLSDSCLDPPSKLSDDGA